MESYHFINNGRLKCPYRKIIWKAAIPEKIKVFLWLALRNKIHTAEVITKKGWIVNSSYSECHSFASLRVPHYPCNGEANCMVTTVDGNVTVVAIKQVAGNVLQNPACAKVKTVTFTSASRL